ncbi:hypothetical protein HELRODRAFT_76471, partial [Helobdella robusta]|uniref:Cytochrome P450 n=1 Tax=Helobdella robusta TaxID=6412 RepID=T1G2K3_HELRO
PRSIEPKATTKGAYKYAVDWIGNGMVLNSGNKWLRSRKLLSPVFHFDNLYKFLKVENKCVDMFIVREFLFYAERGKSVEMMSNLSSLTLDIILRCACSYENNIQEIGTPWQHLDILYKLSADYKKFQRLVKYQHFDFIYNLSSDSQQFTKLSKYINGISDKLIQKRKVCIQKFEEHKLLDESSADMNDILNVLLRARDEDGNGLSDEEVRSELNTLLFAGHDTTAVSISWALYNLTKHSEFQRQCQEEIDDVFHGRTTDDFSHDDFLKFFYLTCYIKESMRLYSTVPALERELTKPLTIDGRECPVGSIINPIIYSLHRNEAVWPNSEKFDPERFFPQNVEKHDPFAFVPFSAGPRNCIGQHFAMNEMKIIMAKILHR